MTRVEAAAYTIAAESPEGALAMNGCRTFPQGYWLTGKRRRRMLKLDPHCHAPTIFDRFRRCSDAWPDEELPRGWYEWDSALMAFTAREMTGGAVLHASGRESSTSKARP